MMRSFFLLAVCASILLLNGCSSFVTRMFFNSIERIGAPIDPPPHMVTTPVLKDLELAVAWVGHATTIIQIHDKVFVTDPLFTNSVGLFMKRLVEPALNPALLPKVDFILVSHTHFDHFSYGSLDMLPKDGTLLIPLGALQYTPEFGFREVREIKPWDVMEEDGVRVTAVPVQHFSGRYGIDSPWMRDHGYTGYVIESRGYTVFFGGDTGYNERLFKEIGRKFKVDVAILPIAPGSLRGIGSGIHVGPAGALKIFQDVGARYMIPMHHRTLNYASTAPPTEARDTLRALAKEMGLSERVIELDLGEQRILFEKRNTPVARL